MSWLADVDFPETVDVAETSTLGDSSKSYIVGMKDSTLSIAGLWDSTLDGILGAVVGQSATLSFEYSPAGTGSGEIKYTGECILTGYSQNSPVGDVVSFSADFQVSGDVTRGTH